MDENTQEKATETKLESLRRRFWDSNEEEAIIPRAGLEHSGYHRQAEAQGRGRQGMKQRPLSRKRAAIYAHRQAPQKWVIQASAEYLFYHELGKLQNRHPVLERLSPQMLGEHVVQPGELPGELPVVTFLQEYFGKFIE